jgi:hypothetical protein
MNKRARFPTPVEDIALNLAFAVMGESRINRSFEEYLAIAARLPPLKVLTFEINELLGQLHKRYGAQLPQLCRFKAGDERITYEPYPSTISYQTVRTALTAAGLRQPRWRTANH